MRSSLLRLGPEERQEYLRRQTPFFQQRSLVFFKVATGLYAFASLQYLVRQILFGGGVFRPIELPVLAGLILFAWGCGYVSRQSSDVRTIRVCAYVYIGALLTAITLYSFIYWEQSIFFVFYHGCGLIYVALMIPWRTREIVVFSGLFMTAFSLYMGTLILGGHPVSSFTRFHPYFDGLIFLAVSSAMAIVIRHNDNQHDVDNFVLVRRVEEQTHQFEKDLQMADRVHKTLIPLPMESEYADIAVTYLPMHYVGGDCAKFRFVDENRLLIFISDVTGHGVPAALLVNRVHAEFERLVREDPRPGALLKNLNRFISHDFEGTQMYLSAFAALIDFNKNEFSYSNYGHPAQYLYRLHSGEAKALASHTSFLGILFDEAEHYEGRATFQSGDSLLLFTDGVIETIGSGGEFFGEQRLKDFLFANSAMGHTQFNEALVTELRRFGSGHFNDDVFILNVKTKVRTHTELSRDYHLTKEGV